LAEAWPTLRVGRTVIQPLSDGEFRLGAGFLVHARTGVPAPLPPAELPIGSFLVPGDAPMLIDVGFGPRRDALLTGGGLLDELRAVGLAPGDIKTIALSHPHPDHLGWLADKSGRLVFERADVIMGAADWRHFMVDHPEDAAPHLRHGLGLLADAGRVRLLDGEERLAATITALPAPGHTPGHLVFAVHDQGERALLLGDAMHCPQQLTEPEWGAVSDLDPRLAAQTREALLRDLERHDGVALGCHFPGLRATRLLQRRQ
jgi:glyoxylase-like metal-dependent hydrolase (beta-lactamase superfamily II)